MNQKIKKYRILLMAILPFTFLNSCENEKALDNQTSGSIKVLIDEVPEVNDTICQWLF